MGWAVTAGRKLKLYRRQILNLLLLTLFLLPACRQAAQPPNDSTLLTSFIGKTGITVEGKFLEFFYRFGGVESLGQPLTTVVVVDGWQVQYFEKGRLEYHPENEPAYRITVGWLGELLHRRRPPIPVSSLPSSQETRRRYFPETGHTLSGDFLTYFETYGGSVRFGLPISEPFLKDGRLVQDLQSARFSWTPMLSAPVTLEDIGALHLQTTEFAVTK